MARFARYGLIRLHTRMHIPLTTRVRISSSRAETSRHNDELPLSASRAPLYTSSSSPSTRCVVCAFICLRDIVPLCPCRAHPFLPLTIKHGGWALSGHTGNVPLISACTSTSPCRVNREESWEGVKDGWWCPGALTLPEGRARRGREVCGGEREGEGGRGRKWTKTGPRSQRGARYDRRS